MSLFDVEKLAVLATGYCAPVSEGKKIGIVGNIVASPLIQQLYKHILLKGGHPTLFLRPRDLNGLEELLFTHGNEKQITFVSPFTRFFYSEIDAVIQVFAETNTKRLSNIPPKKLKQNAASQREIIDIRTKRLLKPGSLAIIPGISFFKNMKDHHVVKVGVENDEMGDGFRRDVHLAQLI